MTVKETENKQKNGRHKLTKAGPGREKGSKNKFTNLKQAFLDTYENIEKESKNNNDIKSLYKWATKNDRNQGIFYQLISKMLPTNAGLDIKGNLSISSGFEDKLKEVFEKHGESKIDELFKLLNKQ